MDDQEQKPEVEVLEEKEEPKLYDPYYWERRHAEEEQIIELYLSGVRRIAKISKLTRIPKSVVRAIVSKAKLRERAGEVKKQLVTEILRTKVDALKEIVDLSLSGVCTFLKAHPVPANFKEAKDLAGIVKNLNEVLRLELGQSTQNVETKVKFSLDDTQHILSELKKIDPVFEYPMLDAPEQNESESEEDEDDELFNA